MPLYLASLAKDMRPAGLAIYAGTYGSLIAIFEFEAIRRERYHAPFPPG